MTARSKQRILVIEDEVDLAEMVCAFLEKDGFETRCAFSGVEALEIIRSSPPDLIVLDRMLPGKPGDQIVGELKADAVSAAIPIVMLTAKADETDQLVGFALGADDYVTKPFSMKVLAARMRAILRRRDAVDADEDVIAEGPIRMIRSRYEVQVDGQPVPMTPTEFKLLLVLMTSRMRVLNRTQLIDRVFGKAVAITDRAIDVHITALRKKLGQASGWVQTVRGVGYTFREPNVSLS